MRFRIFLLTTPIAAADLLSRSDEGDVEETGTYRRGSRINFLIEVT